MQHLIEELKDMTTGEWVVAVIFAAMLLFSHQFWGLAMQVWEVFQW